MNEIFFFFFLAKAFNKKERKQQKFCQSLKDSVEINLSKKTDHFSNVFHRGKIEIGTNEERKS